MSQLKEMLIQGSSFDNPTLTPPDKEIFLILATKFEESTEYLFLNHEELNKITGLATPETWQDFLRLPEVQNYTKSQMAFLAQIAQRKTFSSLVSMAVSGGQGAQQAAKQIQELSGIMNQQDTNRTIILHHIPRPKPTDQNQETEVTHEQ